MLARRGEPIVLLAVLQIPESVGYPLLFALVAAESAGAFVPGETALIIAAAMAADGRLSLPAVIGVATVAATAGDNLGYVLGRHGVRRIAFTADSSSRRMLVLRQGESFFAAHGSTAVFVSRWLPGLRVVGSWIAGAALMPWRKFALWNAAGALAWATSVGLAAYYLGRTISGPIGAIGIGLALSVALTLGVKLVLPRVVHR